MVNRKFEDIRSEYLKLSNKVQEKSTRSGFYSLLNEIENIVYKPQSE